MTLTYTRQIIAGLFFLLILPPLQAAQPLVDANWIMANINNENLVLLDLQPAATYTRYHIPGAINSDYADWRRPDANGIPQMFPPISALETLIGNLGIDNTSHVVLVVTGRAAGEMAAATRVYWTLKVLGHDQISILDGGLIGYIQNRDRPLEQGPSQPLGRVYKADLQSEYLVTAEIVKASLGNDTSIVDNRSGAEYVGLIGGGGKERPGTVPGSIPLPFEWLTVNSGARFHSEENLIRIYQASGVPLQGVQISFCHTGHRTSLAWFVSHELLGNKQARLYDGSMAEWAVDHSLPIEQKIKLN